MPRAEADRAAFPLFHPHRGPGQVIVHHSPRALKVEPLGGDVGHDEVPGRRRPVRSERSGVAIGLAKPAQHRGARHGAMPDPGLGAGAPRWRRRPQTIAQIAHRLPPRCEDQSRPPVREQRAQPLELAVRCGRRQLSIPHRIVDTVEVVEPQLAPVLGRRHQLPPHQLILQLAGEPPQRRAIERAPCARRIPRVQQQAAITAECARERGGARGRRAPQHGANQRLGSGYARQVQPVDHCERPDRGLAFERIGPGDVSAPLGLQAMQGRGLDHETPERWGPSRLPQQHPQRRDAVRRQRIVADAEQQLVEEIGKPIDDRGGGHEQHRPADEPWRHGAVAPCVADCGSDAPRPLRPGRSSPQAAGHGSPPGEWRRRSPD